MIACPACGAKNIPNTVFCEECGKNLLEAPAPRAAPAAERPQPRPARPMLRITIQGTEHVIEAPCGQELLIGRRDGQSGILPTVDLTDAGGLEQGVSRRHAAITFEQGQPCITDLNSTNGTWLGSSPLAPFEATPLHDGDKLTLGTMVLRVRFP